MEHTDTQAEQTKQTPNQGTEAEATPGATCAGAALQTDGEMDKTLRRFLTHEWQKAAAALRRGESAHSEGMQDGKLPWKEGTSRKR